MNPSLRILWVCLLAACAFGSASASSASAAVDHLTCSVAPCILTGEQENSEVHTFGAKGTGALSVLCNKATFQATVASLGVTSATAHPTYSECEAFGAKATITTTGCNYILTGETDAFTNTEGKAEGEDATVDIECEGANTIKIAAPGCTLTIPAQEKLLGVKYTNVVGESGKKEVTIDVTIDKIKYTGAGVLCPAAAKGEHSDGFLTQKVVVKAYEDGGEEGKQINVEAS
jgi:hypothetical protein